MVKENQLFPSKIFCLTAPKIFVRETFSVSIIPSTRKSLDKKGGVSRISVGTLLSHSTDNLHRGIVHFSEKIWYRKNLRKREGGSIKIFRPKMFCLAKPKKFLGESFSASIFSGIKKFYA